MTVFDKARELSYAILETDEYKTLEKTQVEYEKNNISLDEFLKVKKQYNNLIEQIFLLIRLNVYDEQEIEEASMGSCASCNKCKKCKSK